MTEGDERKRMRTGILFDFFRDCLSIGFFLGDCTTEDRLGLLIVLL